MHYGQNLQSRGTFCISIMKTFGDRHLVLHWFATFKKKLLYVMISNFCSIFIRAISWMYQVMGALWPKQAEQEGHYMLKFAFAHLGKNFCM